MTDDDNKALVARLRYLGAVDRILSEPLYQAADLIEAQTAGMSRFTKAEEETLRNHVKHLSAKHVQIMHENVALQVENERLRAAFAAAAVWTAEPGTTIADIRAALGETK